MVSELDSADWVYRLPSTSSPHVVSPMLLVYITTQSHAKCGNDSHTCGGLVQNTYESLPVSKLSLRIPLDSASGQ